MKVLLRLDLFVWGAVADLACTTVMPWAKCMCHSCEQVVCQLLPRGTVDSLSGAFSAVSPATAAVTASATPAVQHALLQWHNFTHANVIANES